MIKVKIYFEGARSEENSKNAKTHARRAFSSLIARLNLKYSPSFVACGPRRDAYNKFFCNALQHPESDHLYLLLVDSETPVTEKKVWDHLKNRKGDKWPKPEKATEDHVYLMAQCMESWFLADKEKLKQHFGQKFNDKDIKDWKNIENIFKDDVDNILARATQQCGKMKGSKKKDSYEKGDDPWEILGLLEPATIREKSEHADRFFKKLEEKCEAVKPTKQGTTQI